jgi:hypothetical protein
MASIAAEQRGDPAGAVEHLNRSMVLDPNPGKHQRKGQLLMRLRKVDEAKRELDQAKAQNAATREVRELVMGGQEEAPEDVRKMAEWASQAASLMEKMDRLDDARYWRLAALGADPSHRASLTALERDAARRLGRN